MFIIPEMGACFVAIPKTGSQTIAAWLQNNFRDDNSVVYAVESLHDWHANIEEVEATGELPFSIYDMWSFAMVRNPFDRLVSYCAQNCPEFQTHPRDVLREKLLAAIAGEEDRWMLPQSYFARNVKKLYRFEELPAAAIDIANRLGIHDAALPHVNKSSRDRYPAYYDSELKSMVEHYYAEDLAAFGYSF